MDKTDGTLPGDTLPGDTLPEELCGLWDSYADNYAISPARLEYDYSSGEAWHLAFAGSIRHVSVFDAESGVIIVEYTEAPEVPYQKGRSDFIAVYYRIVAAGAVKFWNSFDMTGTDTADLEAAREKFSRENSSRFVFSWDSAYTLYRQDAVPLDMGPLRGTWLAGDGFPTWLRITDYRLQVYLAVISPATIVYSGAIVWRSDPAAEEGLILIRFGTDDDCGMAGAQLDAKAGDRCVLAWRREGALLRASVYNDSPASIIPPGAGAGENRALPGPEAFAETTDSAGGLAASGAVWAEFSRA